MKIGSILKSSAFHSMLRQFRIKGLCAAPVTPFKPNGDVNTEKIPSYVQHFVDYGVPNAFVNGTTGEGNSLTLDERKQLAELWVKHGKGKLSAIILQIGANNLRESQELAKHAQSIGADAIACVGTAYYKPDSMGAYIDYMTEVAAAAPKLPFVLYDIDFVTGITYDVSTFFTLAKDKIPNLCGVKHTSPNFVSIHNTVLDHPDVQVLLGTDEMYLQGLSIGAGGTIMNTFNGHILNSLREAYERGDIEAARNEGKKTLAVGKIRRKYGLSVASGSKALLNLIGMDVGDVRLPLTPTSVEVMAKLKNDLQEVGFFEDIKKRK